LEHACSRSMRRRSSASSKGGMSTGGAGEWGAGTVYISKSTFHAPSFDLVMSGRSGVRGYASHETAKPKKIEDFENGIHLNVPACNVTW
jgi:hypothetical protein